MKLFNFLNDLVARAAAASIADLRREEGQTMVEYGLIIALIAILLVASLTAVKGGLSGVFTSITSAL